MWKNYDSVEGLKNILNLCTVYFYDKIINQKYIQMTRNKITWIKDYLH